MSALIGWLVDRLCAWLIGDLDALLEDTLKTWASWGDA